ncbi:MAG: 50S ribosomal protein L24 [Promethearchaeota archaeon]
MTSKSKSPQKQRRRQKKGPLNKRHKQLVSPLSPELRKKFEIRSLPVRKGDTVVVTKGSFSGSQGRVAVVNLKDLRIEIDGIDREKADGTKIYYPVSPANVQIIRTARPDVWRKKIIERKAMKKIEFPEEPEELEEVEEITEEEIEEELTAEELAELEELEEAEE